MHGLVADEADHLVARPESRRRGAGLLDDPGQIPPGGHREEGVHQGIRGSGLESQIRRIERRCLDSHQHEIGEHLRIRNVDDFKDLGSAEALVLNGFHSCAFRGASGGMNTPGRRTTKLNRASTGRSNDCLSNG